MVKGTEPLGRLWPAALGSKQIIKERHVNYFRHTNIQDQNLCQNATSNSKYRFVVLTTKIKSPTVLNN